MGRKVSLERICSVEAVALLLRECGEPAAHCDRLVDYVQLNNAALLGKGSLQRYRDRGAAEPKPEPATPESGPEPEPEAEPEAEPEEH